MTEEKILDRVAKLLSLYEDDRAPQGERDNALKAAQALMFKHALEEADVRARGKKSSVVTSKYIIIGTAYAVAKSCLINELSDIFRCRAIRINARRGSKHQMIQVFGFEDDVETVCMLYSHLSLQMANECEKLYIGQGRTWKNNFYHGFVIVVSDRLRQNNTLIEQETAASEPGMGLALRDIKKDVDQAFQEAWPKTKSTSVSLNYDRSGYAGGNRAGQRADISGGRNNLGAQRNRLGA